VQSLPIFVRSVLGSVLGRMVFETQDAGRRTKKPTVSLRDLNELNHFAS